MQHILDSVEINPKQEPKGTVIWLHGLGADGHDFVPIIQQLNLASHLPLRFIFPHAPMRPVTLNNGYVMRAWYDINSLTGDHRVDQEGIKESIKWIEELIKAENARGIPTDKIILAGFSQGAVIALTTGLGYPDTLGGILALSGYLPQAENVLSNASAANQSIPIFLAHGTDDDVVPYLMGQQIYNLLHERHYSVSWHKYMMSHSVCKEEIDDISQWLTQIF